ncbi:hypothetical protein OAS86_06630 [Gammaproteobacteria bacterium]|nr:hypothetical protein [Gammaproteobacteria bacterium]
MVKLDHELDTELQKPPEELVVVVESESLVLVVELLSVVVDAEAD